MPRAIFCQPDEVVSVGNNPITSPAPGINDDVDDDDDEPNNNTVDLSQDSSEEEGIVDLSRDEEEEEDEIDEKLNLPEAVLSSSPGGTRNEASRPEVVKSEPDAVPSDAAFRHTVKTEGYHNEDDEVEPDDLLQEKRSGVSGTGMFRSFKRIFKTGFMAMLDLFDNAVDATIDRPHGYIECQLDPDDDATIIMHNNSDKPIAPIDEILDVNNSSKGEDDVGENGVGVKQACGYLSNLSFVLTKNRNQFSFGILSRELQTDDYPVLPSYVLPEIKEGVSIRNALEDLTNRHTALEQSLKSWGGGNVEVGLRMLHRKMEMMEICNDEYMFSLVIVKLSKDPGELLDELKEKLPLYYIHIPDALSIKVNGDLLNMRFWEYRLVDLTTANLKISKKEFFYDDPRWQDPIDAYSLRIFVGFDVNRAKKRLDSQLSMYIYSRRTGRLIKKERDARHILGLTGTGSDFCAGFTVIVDDVTAEFELSPSKQDLIFQDYENEVGENHEKNLYSWIGAWCHHIYKSHEKKFGEKRLIGDNVASLAESVPKGELTFSLRNGNFNRIDDINFHIVHATAKIRVHYKKKCTLTLGNDVVQLQAPDQPVIKASVGRARRSEPRSQTPARRVSQKVHTPTEEDSSSGEEEGDRKISATKSTTKSRKRRLSNRDDDGSSITPIVARSANEIIEDIDGDTGMLGSASFEILQLKTQVKNLETKNRQLIQDSERLRHQTHHQMTELQAKLRRAEDHNQMYLRRIRQMESVIAQQEQTISIQSQHQQPIETNPLEQLLDLEQQFGCSL